MKSFGTEPERAAGDRIEVGVSDFAVATEGETLVGYGIGACVAVGLYDPTSGVAGLAHALLPRAADGADGADAKFVDSAIEGLVREMIDGGAGYGSLEAWLVGGASIFELADLPQDVGARSVAVAREELADLDIPVTGAAVGGDAGRTVELDAAAGECRIYTVPDDEPTVL